MVLTNLNLNCRTRITQCHSIFEYSETVCLDIWTFGSGRFAQWICAKTFHIPAWDQIWAVHAWKYHFTFCLRPAILGCQGTKDIMFPNLVFRWQCITSFRVIYNVPISSCACLSFIYVQDVQKNLPKHWNERTVRIWNWMLFVPAKSTSAWKIDIRVTVMNNGKRKILNPHEQKKLHFTKEYVATVFIN